MLVPSATFRRPFSDAARRWRYAPLIAVVSTVLLLAARRLSGAFSVPLSPLNGLWCGLVLAALTIAWSVDRGLRVQRESKRELWIVIAAGTVAAWALTLPGTSPEAFGFLWAVFGAAVAVELLLQPSMLGAGQRATDGNAAVEAEADEAATPHRDGRVSQQWLRYTDDAGRDVIEGTAVARFEAGGRTGSVHLAFCPPFARAPQIDCEPTDALDAEVKAAQVTAYAARLDVKLSRPTTVPLEASLAFIAVCDEQKP